MTISELVGKSADELEAMTDEEVRLFFEPYLKFVRPEKREYNSAGQDIKALKNFKQNVRRQNKRETNEEKADKILALLEKRI